MAFETFKTTAHVNTNVKISDLVACIDMGVDMGVYKGNYIMSECHA